MKIASEQEMFRAEGANIANNILHILHGQPDTAAARLPEYQSQSIQEAPEGSMSRCIAQDFEALIGPAGAIAMQGNGTIRQPGQVAGEHFAFNGRHANTCQPLAADAAGSKIHQRSRANIKREALSPVKASATAWLPMSFKDDR